MAAASTTRELTYSPVIPESVWTFIAMLGTYATSPGEY
jgi:hypothetical protein